MSHLLSSQSGGCFDDNLSLDYVNGDLDGAARAAIEAHADACEVCRRVLSELGRSFANAGATPGADAPAEPPPSGTRPGRFRTPESAPRVALASAVGACAGPRSRSS
jgi:anti-sigma factor RsiW